MTPTVCVINRTRESFLCLSAVAAGNGGAYRNIAREDGIWSMPSPGVYAVGTLFPVDRLYLDRGNRVIHLVEHLDPLQIVPVRRRYASLLEVRTHTIYSSGTRVGDELLICTPEEVETHWKQMREHILKRHRVQSAGMRQEVIRCLNE